MVNIVRHTIPGQVIENGVQLFKGRDINGPDIVEVVVEDSMRGVRDLQIDVGGML